MERPSIDVFFARNSKREQPERGDRLVPRRTCTESTQAHLDVLGSTPECPRRRAYRDLLRENLAQPSRPLNFFAPRKTRPQNQVDNDCPVVAPSKRHPKTQQIFADKALDAPDVKNGRKLKLLDWSVSNLAAVALNGQVFIMSLREGCASSVTTLLCLQDDDVYVTSLAFAGDGSHLSVGLSSGYIMLFDAHAGTKLRTIKDAHDVKVSSVCWNVGTMTSGFKDGTIVHSDTRVMNHVVNRFKGHTGGVCGLSWSENLQYLASGGGDSTVKIWEMNKTRPYQELTGHVGATKAMCWSPYNETNLLTGSLDDGHLYSWNTASGKMVGKFQTRHPISSLRWSPFQKEILTSHCDGTNSMYCWSYPRMTKTKELKGHKGPVLDTALSPDGRRLLSISPDTSVRLWRVFKEEEDSNQSMGEIDSIRQHCTIR